MEEFADPGEDSPDLTDAEIASAVDAENPSTIAQGIKAEVGFQVEGHDIRLREGTPYWRVYLLSDDNQSKVLVFRPLWMKG